MCVFFSLVVVLFSSSNLNFYSAKNTSRTHLIRYTHLYYDFNIISVQNVSYSLLGAFVYFVDHKNGLSWIGRISVGIEFSWNVCLAHMRP